jgi:site-specific DNA-cytosine methylase
MKYLSICSGIEAASVAFGPLGWKPLAFSEIEAFPRAVLQHHYPDTPCHGDFTLLKDEPWIVDADMLCGGTPCQAFSVAGNRQSLADDRGNLTLQFVLLADAIDHLRSNTGREPAWILWENVPGVLSTKDNAFGAFLGGLVGRTSPIPEPADGWTGAGVVDGPTRCAAWRILDAQHFGLAQRRKRVFVLAKGGAGRWAVADALLPIIEGSGWHPAPSRGTGKGVAQDACSGTGSDRIEGVDYENNGVEAGEPMGPLMKGSPSGGGRPLPVVAFAQNTRDEVRYQGDGDICGTLAAEPGMKQTTYVAFDPAQVTSVANRSNPQPGDPCHTLHRNEPPMLVRMREGKEGGGKGPLVSEDQSLTLATANDQVLAYPINGMVMNKELKEGDRQTTGIGEEGDPSPTLRADGTQHGVAYSPKVDTLQPKGINHASTYEADSSSALSTLLEKVGAEAFTQWGLRILGAFQSPEILRLWLHGESVRCEAGEEKSNLVNSAPSFSEDAAGRTLRKLWEDGPDGRTPQGRGLAKQLAGKPGEALSVLSHEGAQDEGDLQIVRQARKGARLLRQALSEIEAARRPEQIGVENEAEMHGGGMRSDEPRTRAVQQARATTAQGNARSAAADKIASGDGSLGPQMMVRRLLPSECEKLQGFPPGYTNIPWRGKPESPDGNRYKALGNSWAVPVVRWIGERIKAIRP